MVRAAPDAGYWDMLIKRSVSRFFLLAALSEGPRHGYKLARAVRDACAGCCQPSDAMVYPTLQALEEEGYISCQVEHTGARKRKVCCLTEKGKEYYRQAAQAWGRFLPHLAQAVEQAEKKEADYGCCEET